MRGTQYVTSTKTTTTTTVSADEETGGALLGSTVAVRLKTCDDVRAR